MGSTRLPGKVLRDLAGRPLVEWICERVKQAAAVDQVVLATTQQVEDDSLSEWAEGFGLSVYRGATDDVLGRYYGAAQQEQADVIVRITADDPFKDPQVIDQVIAAFKKFEVDFAYNNSPPSFPEGLDVEVLSFRALEEAALRSRDSHDREHVTQFLYKNPDNFSQINVPYGKDISWLRWTVDTEEDFRMALCVYEYFKGKKEFFLMDDILDFLRSNLDVVKINQGIKRSSMYDGANNSIDLEFDF